MLYRKAKQRIDTWLSETGTALLVSGARQVGKTRLIRECLNDSNLDYLEVNLIEEPDLIPLFSQATSVHDLIVGLSTAKNHHFIK